MGKRKGRNSGQQAIAAARKRARTTLPSRFECPFCNMHKTVVCTLQSDRGRASVACEQCGMSYNTTCRTLTEPVDVYHEWLDACEAAVHEGDGDAAEAEPSCTTPRRPPCLRSAQDWAGQPPPGHYLLDPVEHLPTEVSCKF
ncbi:hypothetical protein VOLCADRAFT_94457 [Volvox carteri f. nagariensis]|uniref:Transcription elongation factor 1 homolog n=1 Tax=Volvox carteri f. nagariensis TaxID=3068 RepID=D8U4V0_VOLCA|nr:uncharacterized protein VOLCADRAFT_94457 [Volvox carteri f. nagariensis]EFJ45253.1 hypothetical protein VOLCADRAFT_94457 [Volvox carteri f. nagariensis]|eukprot:XP_002953629.1 hypothetical protein VOLCADRAFT_94457 [Volvox carteri f. nagariensis]